MSTQTESARPGPPSPAGGYPVIDSAELNPVRRHRFRKRRELHEIPRQPPGSVLVFQHGDSYEVLPEGTLRLGTDVVVDAVAVAVVSMRHELREAVAYLSTTDPRTCVVLRARFHCWVTDPQLVLDSGCWDVDPILTDHLVADRRLRFMAQATDPHTQWPLFQRNALARLFAYHDMHPLIVPGLRADLVDLAIEPQRLAVAPQPRDAGHDPADRPAPAFDTSAPPAPDDGDGSPAFMSENYTWEETS
jgi:hypothetical protein